MKIHPMVWVGMQTPTYFNEGTILSIVSVVTGYAVSDLIGRCRRREFAYARAIASVLLRKKTSLSYTSVGRVMKRDHATVMHYLREHEHRMNYADYREVYVECLMALEEYKEYKGSTRMV